MKRPLTGLVIAYATGIWAGSLLAWSPAVALGCAGAALLLFLICRWMPVLVVLVFCAGILSYREAVTPVSRWDVRRVAEREASVSLRGVIVSVPEPGESGRASFRLRLSEMKFLGDWERAEGDVWMNAPAEELRYGDEIETTASLRRPGAARNPGELDMQQWLASRGMAFTAFVGAGEPCRVLAREQGNWLTAVALRLRERCERALRCGLESEPEVAGVLVGMVMGKRSDIPPETYEGFQRTGVFHVFAINGLHVGLVTMVVLMAVAAMGVPYRWSGAAAMPVLVLYVWATGAHPGAVRALVMACVWLCGRMVNRPADGLNNLALAALILLAWEPVELFDGGFLLSFAVVTAIVVLTPRIEARLRVLWQVDPFLPRQFVPRWRMAADAAWGWVARLLSCSIAAWVGLVPLLATYFHLFTPVSVVANLLVIPLLGGVIGLGLAATAAHAVWPWLAATMNNASFVLLSVMTGGVEWLGRVPGSHWYVRTPSWWMTVVYYAIGVVLVARLIPRGWLNWRNWSVALGAAGAAAVVMWPEREAKITVMDLQDGVAMFVDLPGERDDFLIDGGARKLMVPFLRAQGVDRLGSVVLTVKDAAHVAGLSNVVAEIPVGLVAMSEMPSRSRPYQQWRAQVIRRKIPIRAVHAGAEWNVQGLKISVLNPLSNATANLADDNALVLRLEYGPTRLLWMSNAGASVERRLVEERADLRCPILIKANHNREASGTEELFDAARPELVVQIANAWPLRRYPPAEWRQRVEQHGAQYLQTDETGAVTIHLSECGYWIQACRDAEPWR